MSQAANSAEPVNRQIFVPSKDLGLAPENMRFDEPIDAGVPQLGETIHAAGILIPIAIRPGHKNEKLVLPRPSPGRPQAGKAATSGQGSGCPTRPRLLRRVRRRQRGRGGGAAALILGRRRARDGPTSLSQLALQAHASRLTTATVQCHLSRSAAASRASR